MIRAFVFKFLPILLSGFWILASASAYADCATVTMGNKPAGYIFYNDGFKVFQYCDGTNWIPMNPPGSGSGGCATATMGLEPLVRESRTGQFSPAPARRPGKHNRQRR